MIIPDVNLLLYVTIDAFPQHAAAKAWWETAVNSTELIGLADPAIFGFLRISTNPRVIRPPLPIMDATGLVDEWLAEPNVRWAEPGPRHLELAFALLRPIGTAGNLTTDAQLAAIAIENDATLCSSDADFARFDGIRWIDPLAA